MMSGGSKIAVFPSHLTQRVKIQDFPCLRLF